MICTSYPHIRGATFRIRLAVPLNTDGWVLTSAATALGVMYDLDIRAIDISGNTTETGVVEISAPATDTALWPLHLMQADFKAVLGDEVVYQRKFFINVEQGVTP